MVCNSYTIQVPCGCQNDRVIWRGILLLFIYFFVTVFHLNSICRLTAEKLMNKPLFQSPLETQVLPFGGVENVLKLNSEQILMLLFVYVYGCVSLFISKVNLNSPQNKGLHSNYFINLKFSFCSPNCLHKKKNYTQKWKYKIMCVYYKLILYIKTCGTHAWTVLNKWTERSEKKNECVVSLFTLLILKLYIYV